jgi:transcriptional regulator with XRE-family HTH domain
VESHYHPNARILARALQARRKELGLSQRSMRGAGETPTGPSGMTVLDYEKGKIPTKYWPATLEKFDQALYWEPGTAEQVLLHGTTAHIKTVADAEAAMEDAIEVLRLDVERRLKKRLRSVARIAAHDDMDPELRAEISDLKADIAMDIIELRPADEEEEDE